MSVFITSKGIFSYDTGLTRDNTFSRLDLFATTVLSLSLFGWASVHIYLSFDDEFHGHEQPILDLIFESFPDVQLSGYRLEHFHQWSNAVNSSDYEEGDIILLTTNDDHALMPNGDEGLLELARSMVALDSRRCLGLTTHISEHVAFATRPWIQSVQHDRNLARFVSGSDGTTLVTVPLLREWFRNDFTGGSRIVRPDNPFGPSVSFVPAKMLIPPREIMRHLDGYSHFNISYPASPLRAVIHVDVHSGARRFRPWCVGNWPRALAAWSAKSSVDLHRTSSPLPTNQKDWVGDIGALLLLWCLRASSPGIRMAVPQRGRWSPTYRAAVVGIASLTPTGLRALMNTMCDYCFLWPLIVLFPDSQARKVMETLSATKGWFGMLTFGLRRIRKKAFRR